MGTTLLQPMAGPRTLYRAALCLGGELYGLTDTDAPGLPEEEKEVREKWNTVKGPSWEAEVHLFNIGGRLKDLQEKAKVEIQGLLKMMTTEERSKEAKELAGKFQKEFQGQVAKMEKDLEKLRDV